ncbi:MAG: PLP-dependent transferase [Hymenobacter sp.]
MLRGLKTLHLRMQRHCENGRAVAEYLRQHPKVEKVYWPGFENHPNHAVARPPDARLRGHDFVCTERRISRPTPTAVLERCTSSSTLAESLGGVEEPDAATPPP